MSSNMHDGTTIITILSVKISKGKLWGGGGEFQPPTSPLYETLQGMGNRDRKFVHKVVCQRWLRTLLVCEHHEPQVIPDDVRCTQFPVPMFHSHFPLPFPTPISCSHPHEVLWIMSIFDIHFITSMYGHINQLWHIPVYYSPATVHKEYRNLLQKWQSTKYNVRQTHKAWYCSYYNPVTNNSSSLLCFTQIGRIT